MTRSNRVLNRVLILLVGLVAIVAGIVLEVPNFAPILSLTVDEVAKGIPGIIEQWRDTFGG